jgi:hypothetical protein
VLFVVSELAREIAATEAKALRDFPLLPTVEWDDAYEGDLYDGDDDEDEPAYCDPFCTDDICRNMGGCAWRDEPDTDERDDR